MRNKSVVISFVAVALATAAISQAAPALTDPILRNAAPAKWLQAVLPEDLPELDLPNYVKSSPIELAEAQAFAGRYKLALITARKATDADPIRLAIVKANALWPLGRTDEALAALGDVKVSADPAAQVLTARILNSLDKTAEAIDLLKSHLEGHPDSIAGHYYFAEFSERVGDLKTAREQYEWFNTPPHQYLDLWLGQGDRAFDSAEQVTLIGKALDRWAILTSAFKDSVQLHNKILDMFVKAYDVIDRTYWPAHVAAAEYYLAHDAPDKAFAELQQANAANPRSAAIDRMMGEFMLVQGKYEFVENTIASLRDVNPASVDADVLEARLFLATGKREAGAAILLRVLNDHPRRLDVIGLLAGYDLAIARPQPAAELFQKADAINPVSGDAYQEAGLLLFHANQNKPAIDVLKTAIDRAPWSTLARNSLGVLYLHSGEDDNARTALEAAYALDPFNPATVNYLRLLDDTAKFLRYESDHFIFLYSPDDDPVVPQYFAPYMEKAYREVCDEFKYEPPVKTIIQVYPDSQRFSIRMSGMPGLETFAATFGRLIVAAAPRAGVNIGPFNWGRVLKHEFAHVVHLTMTDGRVPRWLTEGLAVLSEHVDYRFEWVPPVLYHRAMEHKLFKVAELNQIYARPKGGQDGEMAYMTGFWMSRYLIATYGDDSIQKLLYAYKDGLSDADAFLKATGQPLSSVESAFADWAKQQVQVWGYDKPSEEQYKVAYDHGESLVKQGKFEEAVTAYKTAAKIQPLNPQPHRRLAGVDLKLKKSAEALPELESLIALELTDDRFSKRIAGLYRDADNLAKAIEYGETAVQIDPYDPTAHDLLGSLYEKSGDSQKAGKETEVAQMLRDRKAAAMKAELAPPSKPE